MEPLPLEIDCRAAQALLAANRDSVLIDCREPDEYQLVHIGGSTLLPMSELNQRAVELEPLRGRPIVVHCHHGGRSLRVVQWMRQNGFERAQSLAGGIEQWALDIEPGMPRY